MPAVDPCSNCRVDQQQALFQCSLLTAGFPTDKAQIIDNVDGVVVDHLVTKGNPPDAPMIMPAIARVIARFGRAPTAVTADRGYGEARVDDELAVLGVRRVAIPRRGKANAVREQVQRGRGFTRLVKWRTGCEGRVASLKRNYGWSRTLRDGEAGAASWCGWGVLAHNAVKISVLIANKHGPPGHRAKTDIV